MFPIAHAWMLEQVAPDRQPASYLGAVWPDMLFGSPLSHTQSHRSGAELLAFARALPAGEARDEFSAFVAGVITHGAEPHGFDWFSDEAYGPGGAAAKGYAFQKGLAIAPEVARACDLPAEMGPWKAHNFVEMSFERPLYHAHTEMAQRLAAACADEALFARIADPLARHFAVEAAALVEAMRRYAGMVALARPDLAWLAEAYAHQTRVKYPDARPDVAAIAALITRAEELTRDDGEAYLATSVAGVRETLVALGLPLAA